MKKYTSILNIIMVSSVSVFAGMSIYQCYDYYAHPGLYELTSAPWYTGILLLGAVALVVLVICVGLKVIIKHKKQQGISII